jgi:hypothetical protein
MLATAQTAMCLRLKFKGWCQLAVFLQLTKGSRSPFANRVDQKEKMMRFKMNMGSAVVMTALIAALSGCQKSEGPAEKAGQKIDKAVENAGEKIDQTTEKLGQKVEKAGENMQDAVKHDQKK